MKPLSGNIKEGRKKKGWSQEVFARKVKKSRASVSKWENDKCNPEWEMMPVIMEAFGIKEQDMYPFIYNEKFWEK